jgi:hypothetical protein
VEEQFALEANCGIGSQSQRGQSGSSWFWELGMDGQLVHGGVLQLLATTSGWRRRRPQTTKVTSAFDQHLNPAPLGHRPDLAWYDGPLLLLHRFRAPRRRGREEGEQQRPQVRGGREAHGLQL